jgi:U-box domain
MAVPTMTTTSDVENQEDDDDDGTTDREDDVVVVVVVTPSKIDEEEVDPFQSPVNPGGGAVQVTEESEDEEETTIFPSICYCPITKKIMVDPVVDPSGTSFEKDAVMMLRQSSDGDELITYYPNRALKAYIEALHLINNNSSNDDDDDDDGSIMGTLQKKLGTIVCKNYWDPLLFLEDKASSSSMPSPSLGQQQSSRSLPDEFYCALILDLPHEPVIDPDGYTFEQAAIVHWVQHNADSPITRKPLAVNQLRDNDAVLSILLLESQKPDNSIHPCIQGWKEELLSPPPSLVPSSALMETTTINNSRAFQASSSDMYGTTTGSQVMVYPTTQEEMEEQRRRRVRNEMEEQRKQLHRRVFAVVVLLMLPFSMFSMMIIYIIVGSRTGYH